MKSLTLTAKENDFPTVSVKISGVWEMLGEREDRNSIFSKATTYISKYILLWIGGSHSNTRELVYNFLLQVLLKLDYNKNH